MKKDIKTHCIELAFCLFIFIVLCAAGAVSIGAALFINDIH